MTNAPNAILPLQTEINIPVNAKKIFMTMESMASVNHALILAKPVQDRI